MTYGKSASSCEPLTQSEISLYSYVYIIKQVDHAKWSQSRFNNI